jgi:hypothetical protein
MDYQKVYNQVVERAKSQNRSKKDSYYETHHIVPKCMGGSDDKNNLVLLTAKEHFVCHKLLCVVYPTIPALQFAFWAMCNQRNYGRTYRVSSREYSEAKKRFQKLSSKLHLGKIESEETRRKKARPGELNGMFGRKHTQEVKDLIGKINRGRVDSEETKQKKRESALKRPRHSTETRQKIGRSGEKNASAVKLLEVESGRVFRYIGEAIKVLNITRDRLERLIKQGKYKKIRYEQF